MWNRHAAVLALFAAAPAAAAEDPLSVIPWLSDSIAAPAQPAPDSALPPDVRVAPIDRPELDATGLVDAQALGLPADLWSASEAEDVVRAIEALPRDLPPSLVELVVDLLTARAEPPQNGGGDVFYIARLDRLLEMGRLAEATQMIEAADHVSPELFRRRFDVQLLTGNEDLGCDALARRPDVSPTYSARIFCLARQGDWPAAALTLETAAALGVLRADEDAILARFLADGFEDTLPPPRRPARVTPLVFRMFEAIGEPLPTGSLPLPFAHAELRPNVGWKARIEAAERLARARAIPAAALVDIYMERQPAASGAVWDRVAAVQALDQALEAGEGVAEAVSRAWEAMAAAGLSGPLAEAFGAEVVAATDGEAPAALRLGMLGDRYEEAGRLAAGLPGLSFAASVAMGSPVAPAAGDPLAVAVRSGWSDTDPSDRAMRLVADRRIGEAILLAVAQIADNSPGDPADLAEAIATLRHLGLESVARRAALHHLLVGTA